MSQPGPEDPFRGVPFLGDIGRLLGSQGPVSWEVARQFAQAIAAEGAGEANPDPLERITLSDLARIAEMHVAEVTGLAVTPTGRPVTIVTATRGMWAARALDDWGPLVEKVASSLADTSGPGTLPGPGEPDDDAGEAALFGGIMKMLSPMLMGMAFGSMVGHLAGRAFGQYDLPVPRPAADELVVVPATLRRFAEDWSLPVDDLRMWVLVHELTHHAVLGVGHVRAALWDLMGTYASGFRPDPRALEERIAGVDMADAGGLASLQQVFGDPEVLLGAVQSPEQRALLPRLDALVATVVGYVDHVLDVVGARILGNHRMIAEAVRRRRVEAGPHDRFVARLLGMGLTQAQVDRGAGFVRGVLERQRDGQDALGALWARPEHLPTPAEVDAPGLWLARIGLAD